MRIATEAPERTWINLFDVVLPREHVWMAHMQAAVVLVAVALAYAVYMTRSGLGRRVRLDKIRLRGLFGRGQARFGAFNILLYWVFFIAMLTLIASGGLLYFGIFAGHDVATLHWYATWVIPAFVVLHVLTHFRIAGVSQLLRIFRPTKLAAPPPRLDAVELLTLLVEQSAAAGAGHPPGACKPAAAASRCRAGIGMARTSIRSRPRRRKHEGNAALRRRRNPTFQSNPFVVAAAVAITGASFIVAADRLSVDQLQIHRIDSADAPILDGDTSDRAWRNVEPFSVMTSEGGNFDGKGETRVEIRAVHDGTWAYFLFTWEDPTRSLKQLPLIKEVRRLACAARRSMRPATSTTSTKTSFRCC